MINQNQEKENKNQSKGQEQQGLKKLAPEPKNKEWKEKVLDLRRVTRVVAGGKRFRFRATVILGNNKGDVGVGIAKGSDVSEAISKARAKAMKNIIHIDLKDNRTIWHEATAKYSAAKVLIKPASEGHGIKAGSAVRIVLELSGLKDVTAKCLGRTPNKLTNAMATIRALQKIKTPENKV
jgi:small subunit ribosomal protein S5